MRISRMAWILVAVTAAGLALFMYRTTSSKAASHSVTLHWSPSPCANSYNVYRSTVSGGQYHKIGESPTSSYVDHDVTSGAVLYYVVTSLCQGKESAYSTEIKASVP